MHSVHKMWPIAADRVAWSVCLLVTFVSPTKTATRGEKLTIRSFIKLPGTLDICQLFAIYLNCKEN